MGLAALLPLPRRPFLGSGITCDPVIHGQGFS